MIAVGLAIFCAVVITIYVSIDSIIIDTVETEGSEIAQTKVSLQEADFTTSTGLTTLVQMKVENPKGFQSKHAFSFDKIEVWVDPETLADDVLHIKSMVLIAPEIVYEFANSADNLGILKRYVENSAAKAAAQTVPAKRVIVDNFYVKNGIVVVNAEELRGERKTAKIADIHLRNIGKDENGLLPAELVYQLLLPVLRETTVAALNTDLSLSDLTRNLINGAAGLLDDASEETQKAIKKLKGFLK